MPATKGVHQEPIPSALEDCESDQKTEVRWQSERLDWATPLHRVYDIDALRCECGGNIIFEELIECPKQARAFLALHELESAAAPSTDKHVQLWSDAPNIALLAGRGTLHSASERGVDDSTVWAKQASEVSNFDAVTEVRAEAELHIDEAPPEDSYFYDEIPPD